MRENVTLYHLTRPENVESIKKNGLKASKDGYVYLFEDVVNDLADVQMDVSDIIAFNQCNITEYAMFEVSVPEEELEEDNVAECTRGLQHRVKEYRVKGDIGKCNLKYRGIRSVMDASYDKLAEVSEIAKKMVEQHSAREVNLKDYVLTEIQELSFHPTGKCGCIELNDDYMFGIRCDHLIWTEGFCEGYEPFMKNVKNLDCILVYGNHKGELVMKLLTFNT